MKRPRAPRAFSLLEVFSAQALFLVGLAALIASLSTLGGVLGRAEDFHMAVAAGDAAMKQIVLATSDSALLTEVPHVVTYDDEARANPTGRFTVRWTFAADSAGFALRQVNLTVSWTEHGQARSLLLTTVRP